MPYIIKQLRKELEDGIYKCCMNIRNVGCLNYTITRLLIDYLNYKGKSYTTFNSLIGVLECAKLELYRRMVAPYEDKKKAENGDVY